MLVLPAAGAVLKRWHFHQRLSAQPKPKGKKKAKTRLFDPLALESNVAASCLFNPIFYFVLSILLSSVVMTFMQTMIFGKNDQNNGAAPGLNADSLPVISGVGRRG